jgi:hypothetical protein
MYFCSRQGRERLATGHALTTDRASCLFGPAELRLKAVGWVGCLWVTSRDVTSGQGPRNGKGKGGRSKTYDISNRAREARIIKTERLRRPELLVDVCVGFAWVTPIVLYAWPSATAAG